MRFWQASSIIWRFSALPVSALRSRCRAAGGFPHHSLHGNERIGRHFGSAFLFGHRTVAVRSALLSNRTLTPNFTAAAAKARIMPGNPDPLAFDLSVHLG
jgi:hypothetical protein